MTYELSNSVSAVKLILDFSFPPGIRLFPKSFPFPE